jgi:hypothetical protein
MGATIQVMKLPAGSVVFVADASNYGLHTCTWTAETLQEDMVLEYRDQYREHQIPRNLQAIIKSSVPLDMRWCRRSAATGDKYIYFINNQVVSETAKWPDGTDIQDDEHFEVEAGGLLLEYVETNPNWYNNAYDLFNHKDRINVTKVARKYKGKTASWFVLGHEAPVGAKLGLYFRYADGLKAVHVDDIEKADAPKARKESTSKGPTFRQVFVPGTTWKVTTEIKLPKITTKQVTNPHGHVYPVTTIEDDLGDVIPVGTEFKMEEKAGTYGPGWTKGIWCRIKFDGINQKWARLSDVNGKVERILTAQPTTNADGTVNIDPKDVIPVYYIFDTATQKYYKSDGAEHVLSGQYYTWQYSIEYSNKGPKGCKNWKRLADVRRAVMEWSGYYHNLPGNDRYDNYYTGGPKKFDIPDTWEIHEIDKTTKQVVRKIDLVNSLKRSWSLRELTVKYGSGVRQVYSDLEKKKKLEEFTAVVVFNKDDRDWDGELLANEKAEIDEAVASIDKADIKRGKGDLQVAFAVKDIATGVQIRLSYNGDLQVALIDLDKMAEHVG